MPTIAARFIAYIILMLVSAIPLNISIKLLGGKSSLFKVIIANVAVAIVEAAIASIFGFFSGLISFFAMLFVYKKMFKMSWTASFFAWLLQFVIIAIIASIVFLTGIFLAFL